jgi:hypothetical protein
MAQEAVLLDGAWNEDQPADGRAVFNYSDRTREPLVERSAA